MRVFCRVRNPKTNEWLVGSFEAKRFPQFAHYTATFRIEIRDAQGARAGWADLHLEPHERFCWIDADVMRPKSGYGIALYLAGALLAHDLRRAGVASSWRIRSTSADRFWDRLVARGLATRDAEEEIDYLDARNAFATKLVVRAR